MSNPFIMVFGGSFLQKTIIRNCKKKGYNVLLIDPDKNAYSKDLADVFEVVVGKDFEKTLYIAKKYNVKGIVTAATDKPLLMMAKIAEELNLNFPLYEAVINSTRKDLFKKILVENSLPTAKGIIIDLENKFKDRKIEHLHFPLVAKPVDSSGSRGVIRCSDVNELKIAVDSAMEFSNEKKVLVEEFIEGPEFSVESITYDNITTIIQITDKLTTDFPYNVEMGHTQPTNYEKNIKTIKEIVTEMVKALKLNDCACHAEIKLSENGLIIIENGARLGGDFITSVLVPESTGVNMEDAVIEMSVGKKPDLKHKFEKGSAIRYLKLQSEKKIKEILDWSSIFDLPNILLADFSLQKGDTINNITNSLNRYGYVIANGNSRNDAIKNVNNGLEFLKNHILLTN